MVWIATCVLPFLATILFVRVLIPVSARVGLVDFPGGHKQHKIETPLIGGLAMAGGFATAGLPLTALTAAPVSPLLAIAAAVLISVGIIDDRNGLSVSARVAAQIGAVLIIAWWGGMVIEDLGHLLSSELLSLGMFAVPFTVFAAVGTINAMNLVDGMDGLAASLALVVLLSLVVITGVAGELDGLSWSLAWTGAVGGFLAFNWRWPKQSQARVFMGNGGSLLLGLLITWFLISFSQGPNRLITPVTALWLFALPIYDTIGVMLRRLQSRQSPFRGARDHLHHLLVAADLSVRGAVLVIVALQALMSAFGLIGLYAGVPEAAMFYAFVAISLCYYAAISRPERFVRGVHIMLMRGAMTFGHSRELFVGGLPCNEGVEGFLRRLGPASRSSIKVSLYQIESPTGATARYGVVTTPSPAAARRLVGSLRSAGARGGLSARPFVTRQSSNERRRVRERRVLSERRRGERRGGARVHCIERCR